MRQRRPQLYLTAALVAGARLTAAQSQDDQNRRRVSPTAAGIGFVVAAVLLFILCCGIQRRRVQRAKPYVAPPLPLHTGSGFPHGMQYGSPRPPPVQYPYPTGASEYPPAGAAEFAPPPYVKDSGVQYAPPPGPPPGMQPAGPPPGIEAAYSSPPGPPPRAHISTNSADFNGGFRPPPAS